MRLVPPNLIGSHAGLPENSEVALGVIPDDHVELLRCRGERYRALLLHARACVRDIHRLRDILRIRISRANAERGYRISKTATDLGNIGMVGQEQASAAKITFACASPFALRIWPLAHGNLDDIAQRRRVAEHLVQDADAFGDAEIEAGKGTRVGGRIEKAFSLGTPQHDVDGTFDAGGSLGDDAKDLVWRVRELERRVAKNLRRRM